MPTAGQITQAIGEGLQYVPIPGASLVGSIVSSIGGLISGLVPPRGNLQKFQRTLYPYMRACAQKTGISSFVYWFGEVVEVRPDGAYGAYYSKDQTAGFDNSSGTAVVNDSISHLLAEGQVFYWPFSTRGDGDVVNHPSESRWEMFGNPSVVSSITDVLGITDSGGSSGGSGLIWLLLIGGVIAWLVFRK